MNNAIEKAKQEARKSPLVHRHGCVAIYKGEIISSSFNYYTSAHSANRRTYLQSERYQKGW